MDSPSSSLLPLSDDLEAGFSSAWAGKHSRRVENDGHFLDCCSFCRKTIGVNTDIFMYKGNLAFCSEACRQERMEMDEAGEKWTKSGSRAKKGVPRRKSGSSVRAGSTSVAG